jgi:adenylate cyclase class 2
MTQEFETQILDINPEEIAAKLRNLGAKEEPEVLQKRWVFDIKPCTLKSTGKWIRLRQVEDKKPTLTYKDKSGKGMGETQEIEVTVEDFDKMAEILSKLELVGKYYQENKRHKFELNDIEFTIDTWPKIPTYLEIESISEEKVEKGLKLLGLEGKDSGHIGSVAIYHKYGLNLHSFKKLKF